MLIASRNHDTRRKLSPVCCKDFLRPSQLPLPAEALFNAVIQQCQHQSGGSDYPVHGEFVIKGPRSSDPDPLLLSPMLGKLLVHEKCVFSDGASAGQTGRSPELAGPEPFSLRISS